MQLLISFFLYLFSSLSGSASVDNLTQNYFIFSAKSVQQTAFLRRSVGGSSTLFNGIMMNLNGILTVV